MSGWFYTNKPPEVIPIDDLKPHVAGWTCHCSPKDEDGCIVHNSFDRREGFEPDYAFGPVRKPS